MRFEMPTSISTRKDGLQFWLHLIERNVSYHWEDDPADYRDREGRQTFTPIEVTRLRKLNEAVTEQMEGDACRLFKFAVYLGAEMVELFDITDEDTIHASYERLKKARWKSENLRRRAA